MDQQNPTPEQHDYDRRRKWLSGISLAVVLVLAGLATWFICSWLGSFSDNEFREYIQSFGPLGWLVFLGLQFLQVFIALIPGELLETAAGYAFGPVTGTILCYVGVGLASALVFLLTRRFGTKLVEVFISREKINELRFLNTERKRNNLIFLLFLIPGTPKDLLTYFVGLTDIKLGTFMTISMIARLPSVLSSTVGGHLLGEGNVVGAIWLYAITGALSLLGMLAYNIILRRKQSTPCE
jgi:uncharacterized membrane protein YdjX (TVP38/TMEM64 family)